MSFATVYNTLDALAAAGLSGTLRLGGAARFDPNVEAHHHAVCDRCGAVRDIPAETLAPSSATVRQLQKTPGASRSAPSSASTAASARSARQIR